MYGDLQSPHKRYLAHEMSLQPPQGKSTASTHLKFLLAFVPVNNGFVGVDLSLQLDVLGGVASALLGKRPHELEVWIRL